MRFFTDWRLTMSVMLAASPALRYDVCTAACSFIASASSVSLSWSSKCRNSSKRYLLSPVSLSLNSVLLNCTIPSDVISSFLSLRTISYLSRLFRLSLIISSYDSNTSAIMLRPSPITSSLIPFTNDATSSGDPIYRSMVLLILGMLFSSNCCILFLIRDPSLCVIVWLEHLNYNNTVWYPFLYLFLFISYKIVTLAALRCRHRSRREYVH